MKILIPYFEIMGTDSYPDDASLFSKMQLVEYQGTQHWLTDYTGNKNLQVGATYEQYAAWLATQPPVTGIRVVTKRAFWTRVTALIYAQLLEIAKADSLMQARLNIIDGAEYVDLDDKDLQIAFKDLKEKGLFTTEDEIRIFSDALPLEEPSNLK